MFDLHPMILFAWSHPPPARALGDTHGQGGPAVFGSVIGLSLYRNTRGLSSRRTCYRSVDRDDATTCFTVFFPPETCSFYDVMRGNNEILVTGN